MKHCIARIGPLVCMLLTCASLSAGQQQPATIQILLLNGYDGKPFQIGSNGKPDVPLSITVFGYCDHGYPCIFPGQKYSWTVDSSGRAELPNISNLRTLEVSKPSDWFNYCQEIPRKPGQQGGQPTFDVADILRTGVIAPNTCNDHLKLHPQPGQLIFFLRSLSTLESLSVGVQL